MKPLFRLIQCTIFFYMFQLCLGDEFKLDSIKIEERTGMISGEYNKLIGKQFLIESLVSKKKLLGIELSNNSKNPIKISRSLLAMDESYELDISGKMLPYSMTNHTALQMDEEAREKEGTRWLVIPAGDKVTVCFDPSSWGALDNAKAEKQIIVSAKSKIFSAHRIDLTFARVPETESESKSEETQAIRK